MTPERRNQIEAYIRRLDLDQLPGWTIEQRIIADLWEALGEAWDDGFDAGYAVPLSAPGPNPYRLGERP
jgi:hypothetical protein